MLGEFPDNSVGDQTPQRIDREHDIRVSARVRHVVGEMADSKLACGHSAWYRPKTEVVFVMKRDLPDHVNSARRNQAQSPPTHWLLKRSPRRRLVAIRHPGVWF